MPSQPCLTLTPHLLMLPSTSITLSIALREVPFFPLLHLTFLTCYRGLTQCMQSPLTYSLVTNQTSPPPSSPLQAELARAAP